MEDTIVIIDGNSLINRAYFAMQRPMITKDGIYTQAIFGFMNMLYKIMKEYEPGYMAVAWDLKAPTFRHKQYDEYKAGRAKMPPELAMEMPIQKEILEAMTITNLSIEGFEADDIIGTVARRSEEAGLKPLIITGDRDALQLASRTTHVLITKKGVSEFELYDDEKMRERYGLEPEQFVELKGLMGDSSDHLPGIPGVGEKTGIKLLKQFGTIANLLQHTDEIKGAKLRQKVEDGAQMAAMSRRLAEIVTNVPIDFEVEDLKLGAPDREKLTEIFTKLEMTRFLKKLSEEGGEDTEEMTAEVPMQDYPKQILQTHEDLKALDAIPEGSEVFLKIFGNADHVNLPVNEGAALLADHKYYYVDFRAEGAEEHVGRTLTEKKVKLSGCGLAEDYYSLLAKGFGAPETGFDCEVAEYCLDPSKSDYSLSLIALERLKRTLPSWKDFRKDHAQTDLLNDSLREYADYGYLWLAACESAEEIEREALKKEGMTDLAEKIEFPLIRVLASMEAVGMEADAETLTKIGSELDGKIGEVEQAVYEIAGEKFNINSPAQLGEILFEKMGLPAGKKTKRGYSTSADVLDKLRKKSPIIDLVLEYRTLTKLRSTYVEGLKPLIGPDGRIHAHFQQTVAATGRLSCTAPNLQNIPVRQEMGRRIRQAFVAGEGKTFIGADYSQIELRILAHLSGDQNLIDAFNKGEDIHRTTAARVFGIPYNQVTSLERSRAKAVNFGVIYGMSGFGLSEEIHVSRKEAESYINDYFDKHPAVRAFMEGAVESCRSLGYSETILGRRRWIREIHSRNRMTKNLGERLAMNSPIQGSAADIIKIAMIRVWDELKKRGLKSRLVLQIHDELIIETAAGEEEAVEALLTECMEGAMALKVKLLVDVSRGASWYEMKD